MRTVLAPRPLNDFLVLALKSHSELHVCWLTSKLVQTLLSQRVCGRHLYARTKSKTTISAAFIGISKIEFYLRYGQQNNQQVKQKIRNCKPLHKREDVSTVLDIDRCIGCPQS